MARPFLFSSPFIHPIVFHDLRERTEGGRREVSCRVHKSQGGGGATCSLLAMGRWTGKDGGATATATAAACLSGDVPGNARSFDRSLARPRRSSRLEKGGCFECDLDSCQLIYSVLCFSLLSIVERIFCLTEGTFYIVGRASCCTKLDTHTCPTYFLLISPLISLV